MRHTLAIKFYKAFVSPIKAISFDLDDTLYVNDEVIKMAEQAQFDVLSNAIESIKVAGIEPWLTLKWQVLEANPQVKHDVTLWRKEVIRLGLSAHTDDQALIEQLINEGFKAFYRARSNFELEPRVFEVLAKLKSKFPLVAITNGNVDIHRLGLTPYFVGYYRAGELGNRMKPYPDMLNMAANDLGINTNELLHIGDNVSTDVKAAQNANSPHLWFNSAKASMPAQAALPTGEYSNLDDLLQLLQLL